MSTVGELLRNWVDFYDQKSLATPASPGHVLDLPEQIPESIPILPKYNPEFRDNDDDIMKSISDFESISDSKSKRASELDTGPKPEIDLDYGPKLEAILKELELDSNPGDLEYFDLEYFDLEDLYSNPVFNENDTDDLDLTSPEIEFTQPEMFIKILSGLNLLYNNIRKKIYSLKGDITTAAQKNFTAEIFTREINEYLKSYHEKYFNNIKEYIRKNNSAIFIYCNLMLTIVKTILSIGIPFSLDRFKKFVPYIDLPQIVVYFGEGNTNQLMFMVLDPYMVESDKVNTKLFDNINETILIDIVNALNTTYKNNDIVVDVHYGENNIQLKYLLVGSDKIISYENINKAIGVEFKNQKPKDYSQYSEIESAIKNSKMDDGAKIK